MRVELPTFDRPPVVEVVIGVQFEPLQKLQTPHIGLFWETVRSTYPTWSENPPIVPQMEAFDTPGKLRDSRLVLTKVPPLPRVFFEHETHEWITQLQRDRFLHNWRASSGESVYPRYRAVRKEFFSQWENFQRFASERELGEVRATQLEITYLNHIHPWTESSEVGEVFPDFHWRSGKRSLGKPETCSISSTFKSEDGCSRLRTSVRPGSHHEKGYVLLFDLTVRGMPEDGDLARWFDEGRRWIVTAFADLTSDEWHGKWGLAK